MIHSLHARKERTSRAIIPSGEEQRPTEGRELDPRLSTHGWGRRGNSSGWYVDRLSALRLSCLYVLDALTNALRVIFDSSGRSDWFIRDMGRASMDSRKFNFRTAQQSVLVRSTSMHHSRCRHRVCEQTTCSEGRRGRQWPALYRVFLAHTRYRSTESRSRRLQRSPLTVQ